MAEITLSNGAVAFVDDNDFEELSRFSWHATEKGYAARAVTGPDGRYRMRMHRQILGLGRNDSRLVDHIDGNPLNNQRANLRICTNAENMRNRGKQRNNTTGFKGVTRYLRGRQERWQASIYLNRRKIFIGIYKSPEEAYQAYLDAAAKLHGEFHHG